MLKFFLAGVLILGAVGMAAGQDIHAGKIKNLTINYVPPAKVKDYPLPPVRVSRFLLNMEMCGRCRGSGWESVLRAAK